MYKNISISTKCVDTKLKFTFDNELRRETIKRFRD